MNSLPFSPSLFPEGFIQLDKPIPVLPFVYENYSLPMHIVLTLQVLGILIPVIGLVILMRKDTSLTALNLMIANMGCLVMNGSYFLSLRVRHVEVAIMTTKMTYLGNALFFVFFTRFIVIYLAPEAKKSIVTKLMMLWIVMEVALVVIVWDDRLSHFVFSNTMLMNSEFGGFTYMSMNREPLYIIRYSMIVIWLIGMTVYLLHRRCNLKSRNDKKNVGVLCVSIVFIMLPVLHAVFASSVFDFVPLFSSVGVFFVIIMMTGGEFFIIRDLGRSVVFERMEDAFIIVDAEYIYQDSNSYAKKCFPELVGYKSGELVPTKIRNIFDAESNEIELDSGIFSKTITPLMVKNKVFGYCLSLFDMTETKTLMRELEVARDRAEDANQAKSNFISNMSHEIRTPMNAIVGMTEIMMRTKLNPEQTGYLMNIKNSGGALLTIINDILDFSKIESGKMELVLGEYEPMSMLSDLSMIFLNRIGDRPVELYFDVDPQIPQTLYGDGIRLRQVIINIVNNAIKFTEKGFVRMSISMDNIRYEGKHKLADFIFEIEDSGQGIKEKDIEKIFGSFSQVDTKKNRNKEGTGLGLAISKQIVELMGGTISVSSEYGVGSVFTFVVPQEIYVDELAAKTKNDCEVVISALLSDPENLARLKSLCSYYAVKYIDGNTIDPDKYKQKDTNAQHIDYFLVDCDNFVVVKDYVNLFLEYDTQLVILRNPMKELHADADSVMSGAKVVNLPLYTLNFCQIINNEHMTEHVQTEDYVLYKAPEARILIVDDNDMNLQVATGILQPLEAKIDTANSGLEAIRKLSHKDYDIVFMDHMMPVMDGVETTYRIREMDDEYYKKVPIIALTANAVVEARRVFKEAGMNDFVPKPIEGKEIYRKIALYLPKDKIVRFEDGDNLLHEFMINPDEVQIPEEYLKLQGIDARAGVKNSGGLELFVGCLSSFVKVIDIKSEKIRKCLADGLIRDFTIEVHALKNSARLIGALKLSQRFLEMEEAGNAGDVDKINNEIQEVLARYEYYKTILEAYAFSGDEEKKDATIEEICDILNKLKAAMDNFDIDMADEAEKELETVKLPNSVKDKLSTLSAYVSDVAMDEAIDLADWMIDELRNGDTKIDE